VSFCVFDAAGNVQHDPAPDAALPRRPTCSYLPCLVAMLGWAVHYPGEFDFPMSHRSYRMDGHRRKMAYTMFIMNVIFSSSSSRFPGVQLAHLALVEPE
jgi:hypothetical protein